MRHRDFGVLVCDQHRATPGYTLFTPIHGKTTYLIGLRGDIVHQWEHPLVSGPYGYLLDNGNLLWAGRLPEGPQHMGGRGGLLREYDWDGKVVWEHRQVGQHHDFRRLPNGNTIFLGWEIVPPEIEKRVPGGLPGTLHPDGCMYGDYIHEVTPDGKVVWEWHACRDMEVEKYIAQPQPAPRRVCPCQRDFAAAQRRHLHQLPPPQHDRADRSRDAQAEVGAPRRQLRACSTIASRSPTAT